MRRKAVVQARSASPGGRWGPVETLGRAGYDPALALAVEVSGGATVAWEADDAVNVARHARGRRFQRPVSFPRNGPQDGATTALATSADGRAYVAFATTPAGEPQQDVPQPFVVVAARGRDGRWSTPRRVSGRPAAQPRMTVATDGAVVVAWRESSFNADDMPRYGGVGAAIGSADASFGPPLHVADASTTGLLLVAGLTGETVLAWSSPRDGTGPLDYAVRVANAAKFTTARRAPRADADLALGRGTLAMLDDGTALFLGPNGPRIGIRLAIRPSGGTFARARLILERGSAPIVAVAGRRATVVYRDGDHRVARVVTLSRR